MQNREVRLAAVLSAQMLGFDRFFEQDAEEALDLLDRLSALFTLECGEHRGRIVRSVRDSYLAEFPTALDAVRCSAAILEAAADLRPEGAEGCRLTIGIHVGDVHFLENDAAGETVAIAARLQSMARGGRIVVSGEVYRSVAEKLPYPADRRGDVQFEGSKTRIEAYELDPAGRSATRSEPAAANPPAEASAAQDFDELKAFVLAQIKRVGRRISTEKLRRMIPERSAELDEAIEKLADMGFLSRGGEPAGPLPPRRSEPELPFGRGYDREAWREAKHAIREAVREARHEHHHHHHHGRDSLDNENESEILEGGYSRYRERVIEKSHRAIGGFVGHLVPFLVVNGFLFFLNLSTGFSFPWFLFPLGGWGIGIISHFVTVGTTRRDRADVEALPETLDESDFRLLRSYHKARSAVRATIASTLSVAAFLLMVNLVVSPGFLWALFPIAGLFIAIVSSTSTYLSKRGSFRKRLRQLFSSKKAGAPQGRPLEQTVSAGDPPVVKEAVTIAGSILDQAKNLDPSKAYLGEDLQPLLESYIGQIRTLTRRKGEVDEIMAAIPRVELQKDLEALEARYAKASEGSLKQEYRRSIEQIERQNRSYEELEDQKELLELRVTGSLNSLKQMQIDLARLTGLAPGGDVGSVERLREKSRELSEYLRDFGDSYNDLEGLPRSSEAERRRADELLEEFKRRESRSQREEQG